MGLTRGAQTLEAQQLFVPASADTLKKIVLVANAPGFAKLPPAYAKPRWHPGGT